MLTLCYARDMRVCIFGAGGRTGMPLVRLALEKGYDVTAFVHHTTDKARLPKSPQLHVIMGDVLDRAAVSAAVKDADAIISVLGHKKGGDPRMQTKGIQHICEAAEGLGVTRLVSLTGTGVRQPGDTPSFIDRFLNFLLRHIDPVRIHDGIDHAHVVENSKLNWTILRVLKLSGAHSSNRHYQLTPGGPAELFSARPRVAEALLDLAGSNVFVHTMPVISPKH